LRTAPCSRQAGFPRSPCIILHPQPPACVRMNSRTPPPRREVALNRYATRAVLIRPQVRSHPTTVLPIMGGRCSPGFSTPSKVIHQLAPIQRIILSCTWSFLHPLNVDASCSVLQSLENQPPGVRPLTVKTPTISFHSASHPSIFDSRCKQRLSLKEGEIQRSAHTPKGIYIAENQTHQTTLPASYEAPCKQQAPKQ
jgi:hypothetical protein